MVTSKHLISAYWNTQDHFVILSKIFCIIYSTFGVHIKKPKANQRHVVTPGEPEGTTFFPRLIVNEKNLLTWCILTTFQKAHSLFRSFPEVFRWLLIFFLALTMACCTIYYILIFIKPSTFYFNHFFRPKYTWNIWLWKLRKQNSINLFYSLYP